jgi:hypothetical protein
MRCLGCSINVERVLLGSEATAAAHFGRAVHRPLTAGATTARTDFVFLFGEDVSQRGECGTHLGTRSGALLFPLLDLSKSIRAHGVRRRRSRTAGVPDRERSRRTAHQTRYDPRLVSTTRSAKCAAMPLGCRAGSPTKQAPEGSAVSAGCWHHWRRRSSDVQSACRYDSAQDRGALRSGGRRRGSGSTGWKWEEEIEHACVASQFLHLGKWLPETEVRQGKVATLGDGTTEADWESAASGTLALGRRGCRSR